MGNNSPAADEPPTTQPIKLQGKLVCIGDSITAGEGVKPAECYVGLLAARAKENNLQLEVLGQGHSGWETGTFLAHKTDIINALPPDATIITIELGTNDAHHDIDPAQIASKAASNLDKLIELLHAKAPHAQFVVVAPTAVVPEKLSPRLLKAHYSDRTPAALKAIRNAYEILAHQHGFTFLDLSQCPSPENTIDGVHPNPAGHHQMADGYWAVLTAQH